MNAVGKTLLFGLLALSGLGWACWGARAAEGHAPRVVVRPEERIKIEEAIPAKALVTPSKPRKMLIFDLNVGYGGHPSIHYANLAFTLMGEKTGTFQTVVSRAPSVFE